MRTLVAVFLLAVVAAPAFGQVHVRGHYRKDGTYVQPHIRSAPNSTRSDNYGSSRVGGSAYGSSYAPAYVSPYQRDADRDGVSNQYDSDDDNDGLYDDYDENP
jgi:hypothetical protein